MSATAVAAVATASVIAGAMYVVEQPPAVVTTTPFYECATVTDKTDQTGEFTVDFLLHSQQGDFRPLYWDEGAWMQDLFHSTYMQVLGGCDRSFQRVLTTVELDCDRERNEMFPCCSLLVPYDGTFGVLQCNLTARYLCDSCTVLFDELEQDEEGTFEVTDDATTLASNTTSRVTTNFPSTTTSTTARNNTNNDRTSAVEGTSNVFGVGFDMGDGIGGDPSSFSSMTKDGNTNHDTVFSPKEDTVESTNTEDGSGSDMASPNFGQEKGFMNVFQNHYEADGSDKDMDSTMESASVAE